MIYSFWRFFLFIPLFILSCENASTSVTDPVNNGPHDDPPAELEWQLVWSDEFDGNELDMSKWSYMIGTGVEYGIPGWGNNELQYYTDHEENIFIENNMLHIVAREERIGSMNYTSARIRTYEKGDWMYGRFEIRAKLPEGQGIWPAIWMLPTDNVFGTWPKSGEIDIVELVGHEPSTIHGTVHYGPDWPENQQKTKSYTLPQGKFSDDFHVFAISWSSNEIQWFIDDVMYHTITPASLQPHNYPFNARFHLLINLAVGGNWPGRPDNTTEFSQSLIVDYVRVYQLK
jgi:beta-glucanase (GH16 family)